MITFLKAQTASLVATFIDFLVTFIAVEFWGSWYLSGTVLGTATGGIAHFSVSRIWVFNSSDKGIPGQVGRYVLAWAGNLLLNALGVWTLTQYAEMDYLLSKVWAGLLVAFFYNYIIQKKYVFQ